MKEGSSRTLAGTLFDMQLKGSRGAERRHREQSKLTHAKSFLKQRRPSDEGDDDDDDDDDVVDDVENKEESMNGGGGGGGRGGDGDGGGGRDVEFKRSASSMKKAGADVYLITRVLARNLRRFDDRCKMPPFYFM